jgi:hypothetical protein
MRLLDDDNGLPGDDLVSATQTTALAGGWVAIFTNLTLKAGTYWVAIASDAPMGIGATCAFAASGPYARFFNAYNPNPSKWVGPYMNPVMVEAGECPM